MSKIANLFRTEFQKVFSDPSVKANPSTVSTFLKYNSALKEDESLKGGKADKMSLGDIAVKHKVDIETLTDQFLQGVQIEKEHTKDRKMAVEIAMDHLAEDPHYYKKLKKIETNEDDKVSAKKQFSMDLQMDPDFHEFKKNSKYFKGGSEFSYGTVNATVNDPYIKKTKRWGRPGKEKGETAEATSTGSSGGYETVFGGDSEFWRKSKSENKKPVKEETETTEATGSGSSGAYETPSAWSKSTKPKDWGPSRKTQIPGGGFVKVKKKCTKFPYCNQGDINALKITKNESVKEAISNVSKKLNVSEKLIENILIGELSKQYKRVK
jgi:hypothetical protein